MGFCELDRIGKQIIPDKGEHFLIGVHPHGLFHISLDFQILCVPGIFEGKKTGTKLFAQIVDSDFGINLLIFQFIELKNIGNQVGETARRIGNGFGILHAFFIRKIGLLKQCTIVLHHGQRGL